VYLAHLPETLTGPVLRGERESGTRDDVPDAEITRIKETVQRDGVALTSGGVIPGVTSVAAPVFTAGSLPLVVAIALPARVATDDVLAAVTAELRSTTRAMSAELGHAAPRGA
jgi:DNA-binding IclR family transcriptional regulator